MRTTNRMMVPGIAALAGLLAFGLAGTASAFHGGGVLYFGQGSLEAANSTGMSSATSVIELSDGRIAVAGSTTTGSGLRGALVIVLGSDGVPDPAFGGDGIVIAELADVSNTAFPYAVAETPTGERAELLTRFRDDAESGLLPREPLKYLCNYGILTVGFDCPRLDAIAILRPTMSPGLLVQMIGRGTRLSPGKRDCLVLDYGGNILRHGPIDQIKAPNGKGTSSGETPAKECPECGVVFIDEQHEFSEAYKDGVFQLRCPRCGSYKITPTGDIYINEEGQEQVEFQCEACGEGSAPVSD